MSTADPRNAASTANGRARATLLGLAVACVVMTGCEREMRDQPRYEPLEASAFFDDGNSSRDPVEGTVARGQLRTDRHLYEGIGPDGNLAADFPVPVTREFIERGHERYNIYCTPCHGQLGNGLGMVVRRGFKQPNSFHIERLRTAPPGYFYDVITNGFGTMSHYRQSIKPVDRWAITAYIRALQASRNVQVEALPLDQRLEVRDAIQRVEAAAEHDDEHHHDEGSH